MSCLWKVVYVMSNLWNSLSMKSLLSNVLSMKCHIIWNVMSCLWNVYYEVPYLWNVLSMKCPIYEMSCLWNVISINCLSMKCSNTTLSIPSIKTWKKNEVANALTELRKSIVCADLQQHCTVQYLIIDAYLFCHTLIYNTTTTYFAQIFAISHEKLHYGAVLYKGRENVEKFGIQNLV